MQKEIVGLKDVIYILRKMDKEINRIYYTEWILALYVLALSIIMLVLHF